MLQEDFCFCPGAFCSFPTSSGLILCGAFFHSQPSLLMAAEVRVGALKQQHRVLPPSLIWEAKNPGPTSTICFPPLGYCLLWREVRPWSGCPLSGLPHMGLTESPYLCCGALGDAICPSGHERDPDEEELWKTQGCVVRGAEEGILP